MVKTLSKPLMLVALFAVSACSAGTTNSAVPSSQPMAAQSAAQATAVSRTLAEKDKAPTDVDYGYTLFGDATLVHPGHSSNTAAQARWAGATAPYGGVDFAFPAGATYSQLQNLSSDYQFTVGSCGDGAPRFVVTLTNGTATGNAMFYFGPPPNFTLCPPNVWNNTGNLASPPNTVDDSQLPGGTFYDPYAASQAKFGTYAITDVFVVVDGFTAFRTVQWDNVGVTIGSDNEIYTFEKCGSDNGFTDNDTDDAKCNNDGNGNNNNNNNGNGNNNNGNGNK